MPWDQSCLLCLMTCLRFRDQSRATTGDPLLQFIFILIGNILCSSLLHINKPKPYSSFSKTNECTKCSSSQVLLSKRAHQKRCSSSSYRYLSSTCPLSPLSSSLTLFFPVYAPELLAVMISPTTSGNPVNMIDSAC